MKRIRDISTDGHALTLTLATALLGAALVSLAGCDQVNMKRFSTATRIDVILNPGWHEFDEPFQTQYARLSEERRAACTDPEAIARVYDILARYKRCWSNFWAVPPESPPAVLIFHNDQQWLGTLNLYATALGHVHNLVRRIDPDDAAAILQHLCDCDESSAGESSPAATNP